MTVSKFGLPPRGHDSDDVPPELAAAATRIDIIIAVFAFGVFLGSLI